MPEFLADGMPVTTQDVFVDELTLGPTAGVRAITFSVLGVNAVVVQCWRYTDDTKTKWALEQVSRVFAGQSIGVVVRNCAGLRIANATAGKTSLVVGELDYESDVELSGGSITSASIDGSGNITPSPGVAVTRTILASGAGTYQTPAGCRAILVECVGGGGGGGGVPVAGASQTSGGGGGGGGAYAASIIASPASSYSFVVGAGGTGVVGGAGNGGGDTTFNATMVVAKGGQGGALGVNGGVPAPGSNGGPGGSDSTSTGDVTLAGHAGGVPVLLAANLYISGGGGAAARGGGGAASQRIAGGSGGGSATKGGGGSGALQTFGAGVTRQGGNGGDGLIVITEFY